MHKNVNFFQESLPHDSNGSKKLKLTYPWFKMTTEKGGCRSAVQYRVQVGHCNGCC